MKSSPKSGLMRSSSVKSKLIWTRDLRDKFQKAIEKLGVDNAVPKKILELMKVKGLTRDNVASHLQKYRIVQKRLAASSNGVVITSKPTLLESSMTNEAASWMNSSLMLNQQAKNGPSNCGMYATNPPILDTSSTYVPVVEASNFNATFALPYPGSLSVEGNYSMQEMSTHLDKHGSLINDASNLGVANSLNSSSGFVQNCDGFTNSCRGYLTEEDAYNNIEMDSSSGVHWNSELEMTWNHEKPIITGNSESPYFVENTAGSSESNYSSQSEFVEMGLMYGSSSRENMKNEIGELDLIWDGAHIDYLLSCGSDNRKYQSIANNLPHLDPPNQVVAGENFLNNDSLFDSYQNNASTSIDLHQTLEGYLHDFDHISNKNNVTPAPPNQDVNDQNSPDIIPFGSNAELTSINEVQTTDGNLPTCDQTFHMNNVTFGSPNQDANGQYFLDDFTIDSNEATSINEEQTLDGFLSSFDPTHNMHNDELIEPIWSPEPITNDMIRQGYF